MGLPSAAAKPGVVECGFEWAVRFRRLAKDYERPPATVASLHFVAFACLFLHRAITAVLGSSPQQLLEKPSFPTKQQVLWLVIGRIVVDSKAVIQHVVPVGPVRLQTERLPRHWYMFPGELLGIARAVTPFSPLPGG